MAYNWFEEFFKKKVLPGLLKELQPCADVGFYVWLKERERGIYDELTLAEQQLNEIWLKAGEKEDFKKACKAWVMAHLRGKGKYLAAMAMPQPPAQQQLEGVK